MTVAHHPGGTGEDRIFSQAESEAIMDRVEKFAPRPGDLNAEVTSWWNGELRWGRNRTTLASDRRDRRVGVGIPRDPYMTNQIDDESLQNLVRAYQGKGETAAADSSGVVPVWDRKGPIAPLPMPTPPIWSDATFNVTSEVMAEVARKLTEAAEAQKMLSAGYLEVRAGSRLWVANGARQYARFTQAQCSMTVRDTQGTGSGWAGLSSVDWGKIDAVALAQRALAKCVASRNPVALEPGRYTVILEPQAVADLMEIFVQTFFRPDAPGGAENGDGPWVLARLGDGAYRWRSKLGVKVVDERVTLEHDLMDPNLGVIPEPGMVLLDWIKNGVLTNLYYGRGYAVRELRSDLPVRPPSIGYRVSVSGPTTSIDEMIATTKRGVLVTRLWGVQMLDYSSILSTGLTRDGVWLIENGKIAKPVKNFRFTESPLFMLNQVEQLGEPVPVFRPVKEPDVNTELSGLFLGLTPAVVPAIKARDFSFTAMADAV